MGNWFELEELTGKVSISLTGVPNLFPMCKVTAGRTTADMVSRRLILDRHLLVLESTEQLAGTASFSIPRLLCQAEETLGPMPECMAPSRPRMPGNNSQGLDGFPHIVATLSECHPNIWQVRQRVHRTSSWGNSES